MFEGDNQAKSFVNCNFVVELSKRTQIKTENKKVQEELTKPIPFIRDVLSLGINKITKIVNVKVPNKREIILTEYF